MNDLGHFKSPLKQTPFHPRTAEANQLNRWGAWGRYMTALCFGDTAMEHTAIRNAAKLPVGSVHYTAWCDDEGKVLDDGTLFRHGLQDYLICCQERHLPWLAASATGFDVSVREVTNEVAALSLQGPCWTIAPRPCCAMPIWTLAGMRAEWQRFGRAIGYVSGGLTMFRCGKSAPCRSGSRRFC